MEGALETPDHWIITKLGPEHVNVDPESRLDHSSVGRQVRATLFLR